MSYIILRGVMMVALASMPSGYAYPSAENAKQQLVPRVPVPPRDPVVLHKSVTYISEPNHECPKGFHSFKDKCVQFVKVEPELRCSKGYELFHTADGVECVLTEVDAPNVSCKAGYELREDSCVQTLQVSPEYRCRPRFVLLNGHCVQEETATAQKKCESGYVLTNDQCLVKRVVAPTQYCEDRSDDLESQYDRCVGVTWKTPQMMCPSRTIPQRDGTCVQTDIEPLGEQCSADELLIGSECVTEDRIQLTTVCDGSVVDSNGDCVTEQVLDTQLGCPPGFVVNRQEGVCERIETQPLGPICFEGIVDNSVSPPVCRFQQSVLPATLCPTDYEREGSECIKRRSTRAEPSCTDGYFEFDGQCRKDISLPQIKECTDGYQQVGDACQKKTYSNALTACPPGFIYEAGQCITEETAPPQLTCQAGFTLKNDICMREEYAPAKPICTCVNCQLVGDSCVLTTEIAPEHECKAPYSYSSESGLCEYKKAKEPDVYCPKDYKYAGRNCTKTETAEPYLKCEHGYTLDPETKKCRGTTHRKDVASVPTPQPQLYDNKKNSHGWDSNNLHIPISHTHIAPQYPTHTSPQKKLSHDSSFLRTHY